MRHLVRPKVFCERLVNGNKHGSPCQRTLAQVCSYPRRVIWAARLYKSWQEEGQGPPGPKRRGIVKSLPVREKSLIERIRRQARRGTAVVTGIGDDCAVLRLPAGHELLVTTDFTLEDVHFRRQWHPPEVVGWRCLMRGLSDIAAMGGEPRAAFLSMALDRGTSQKWVDR